MTIGTMARDEMVVRQLEGTTRLRPLGSGCSKKSLKKRINASMGHGKTSIGATLLVCILMVGVLSSCSVNIGGSDSGIPGDVVVGDSSSTDTSADEYADDNMTTSAILASAKENGIQIEAPYRQTFEDVNLDGVGHRDDTLCVSNYSWQEDSQFVKLNILQVRLGTGESFGKEYFGCYTPYIQFGHIRNTEKKDIVLTLETWGSNYGAAELRLLEVQPPTDTVPNPQLVETLYLQHHSDEWSIEGNPQNVPRGERLTFFTGVIEHVSGAYDTLELGIESSTTTKSDNHITLDWSGDEWIFGDLVNWPPRTWLVGGDASEYVISGDYQYGVNPDHSVTIIKYLGKGGDVEIPALLDGKQVIAIGNIAQEYGAFQNCDTVTSVMIPEGVAEIQDNAFQSCHNLTTVTIPSSAGMLGNCAFDDCPKLQSVYMKGNPPETADYVFTATPELTFYYNKNVAGWAGIRFGLQTAPYIPPAEGNEPVLDDYEYKGNSDNTVTITKYTGKGGDITIPAELDGKKVTSIGNIPEGYSNVGAFRGCDTLTSVIIPASVISIQRGAFAYCSELRGVYFEGDAPEIHDRGFLDVNFVTLYYDKNTAGWEDTWYGCPLVPYE